MRPAYTAFAAAFLCAAATPGLADPAPERDPLNTAAQKLPVTNDPDVEVQALIGDTIRARVGDRSITLQAGDFVRYRGSAYKVKPIDNHLLLIGAEGQDPVILPVEKASAPK